MGRVHQAALGAQLQQCWVLSSSSVGRSPRSPDPRAGSPGSSLSHLPVWTLNIVFRIIIFIQSKRKQLPCQVHQPSSSQAQANNACVAQLLLRSGMAFANVKIAPRSSSVSITAEDTWTFCTEREIPPEAAGQEAPCPASPGSPGQRPCTHHSVLHATNHVFSCYRFQNTQKNRQGRCFALNECFVWPKRKYLLSN